MTTLGVFWDSVLVGHLTRAGDRDMSFRYAQTYLSSAHARQISLSLPLQEEPFDSGLSRAWFANLLPEGEIRGQVARALGVSERNDFAILEMIGGDCAGALQLLPAPPPPAQEGTLIPLPWAELEAKVAATPRPSLLALMARNAGLRLSLAGAQDKLPVHWSGGELELPAGRTASTHLLKISSGAFPDLVQNEFFCMTLAERVGLPVAHVEMAPTRTPMLLVRRFDRRRDGDGQVVRIHQEDFCQALGLPPELKYESEGGPSLADLFQVLSGGSGSPLPDKRDLLKWVIFNCLIGNADGHAKNVSFLMGGRADPPGARLAPFYDLVCTGIYDTLSRRLAQKIGGENRPRFIARRHWDRLAESIDVNPRYLRTVALELSAAVELEAGAVTHIIGVDSPPSSTLNQIVRLIGQRTKRLRAQFEHTA